MNIAISREISKIAARNYPRCYGPWKNPQRSAAPQNQHVAPKSAVWLEKNAIRLSRPAAGTTVIILIPERTRLAVTDNVLTLIGQILPYEAIRAILNTYQ